MKEYFPEGVARPFVQIHFPIATCRYVVSDYTGESILKLKSHPWYSDFVSQGVVDFAVVDCEKIPSVLPFLSLKQIKLELSNKELNESTMKNPLFVIANYVFSNLRSDVIRIENTNLHHGLLTLSCPQDNGDSVNIIPRLQ